MADKEVVGDENAHHGRQKDCPAGDDTKTEDEQEDAVFPIDDNLRNEGSGSVDIDPRADGDANDEDDVRTSSDVDIFGPNGGEIHRCGYRIKYDAKRKLTSQQAQAGKECARSGRGGHGLLGGDEDQKWIPQNLPINLRRRRGDQDAEQRRNANRDRRSDGLAKKSGIGRAGISCPVWLESEPRHKSQWRRRTSLPLCPRQPLMYAPTKICRPKTEFQLNALPVAVDPAEIVSPAPSAVTRAQMSLGEH